MQHPRRPGADCSRRSDLPWLPVVRSGAEGLMRFVRPLQRASVSLDGRAARVIGGGLVSSDASMLIQLEGSFGCKQGVGDP